MPPDAQHASPDARPNAESLRGRAADRLAVGSVLLAAAAYRLATNDDLLSAWALAGVIALESLVVIGIAAWVRKRPAVLSADADRGAALTLLAIGTFVFLVVRRQWDGGLPWELVLVSTIRTLALGLAVFSETLRFQRLGMLLAVLLVAFAISLARSASPAWAVVLFCVTAITWLVLQDWQRFSDRLLDRESVAPRKRWLLFATPLVLLFIVGFSAADEQTLTKVRGWFPSSGGDGDSDPHARDGVGDGNALVPGEENIKSIAPLEDAPFLTDDRPSLYDTYDDTYEDAKPPTKTDRAISIDPSEAERGCERVAKSEQNTKEFSTLRQERAGDHRRLEDQESPALLHVAGRVPLHLRTEVFDLYDGLNWYPQEKHGSGAAPQITLKTVGEKPWMTWQTLSADWLVGPETHVLKMIRYGSPVIPTPLHTTGLHIDRVDRPSMFRWRQPGVVALDRDEMPPLIPIRVASKTIDRDSAPQPSPWSGYKWARGLPDVEGVETFRELASEIARDTQPGWAEIDAVVEHLRTHYRHDRSLTFSDASVMPVEQFLTETKAGPDYLFATAAALMLRSRGYACRVVSGFYASPEDYDRQTKLTSVGEEDVHFWVEVYCGMGTWVTVEPTPGYEVLQPPRSVLEVLGDTVVAVWSWVVDHPALSGLILLAGGLLFAFRVPVQDAGFAFACRLPLRPERRLAKTFALLERRLVWCGRARPASKSPHTWWASLEISDPELDRLHAWIDARLFAATPTSLSSAEARALTDTLLKRWTLRRLREHLVPAVNESTPELQAASAAAT